MKKAAHAVMGSIHVQLGSPFEALVSASIKDPSLRDQLLKTFSEHPHDLGISKTQWPKCSLLGVKDVRGDNLRGGTGGFELDIPKLDLFSELPPDILTQMVSRQLY